MNDVITMSHFGRMGRFGNQLFQYMYLWGVSRRTGAQLQLPPWVGNELFGLCNPPPAQYLPAHKEREYWGSDQVDPVEDHHLLGHDFTGYAQYHTRHFAADKDAIQTLFQPAAPIFDRLVVAQERLLSDGPVIGVHLRRGDYGRSIFPVIPVEWYLHWLKHVGAKRLFIATEDTSLLSEFKDFDVVTSESLGVDLSTVPMAGYNYLGRDLTEREPHQLDFYPDFYLLSQCNSIIGPNSTFSFAAAMFAPRLLYYWRASLTKASDANEAGCFVDVDPWDSYPLLRENVGDFPHLPGIALAANPYW